MDAPGATPNLDDIAPGLPRPGDVLFGKYRIERVVGRGGMGIVYAAHHEALNQRVALKLLLPHAAEQRDAASRFQNEARAAARIKDEHVAKVMDVGQLEDGRPYIVLEYLEGRDLSKVLEASGPFSVADATDYVIQALSAIAHAHAAGIVHRDLKPSNLFLAEEPGGRILKVLDFGVSKLQGSPGAELTNTTALLGSPGYMSPEQVRSARNVDRRADIWSIGVILYRLLTGEGPFHSESMGEMFAAVLHAPPPPLRAKRPEVPRGLEQVVLRCLEKDRAARWTSAGELAMVLAPYASVEGQRLAEKVARIPPPKDAQGDPLTPSASSPTRPSYTPPVSAPGLSSGARLGSTSPLAAAPPDGGSFRARLALGAAAVAVAALLGLFFARGARSNGTTTEVSSTASAAPMSTAPPRWYERAPKDASDKYLLGLKSMRDGFHTEAAAAFREATQANEWLAPAYLRRAILELTRRPDEMRVDFANAVEHQDRLDARDVPLFEAFKHQAIDTPPDDVAWEDALGRASDAHPDDPEIAYYLGLAHSFRGKNEESIAALERAIAADPQFAAALGALAAEAVEVGDFTRAKAAADQCLALPRRSPSCSHERIRLLSRVGDADGVLTEAEAWIKADPTHADEANAFKAEAMYAQGRPLPAVAEAVRQRTRRLGDERSRTKLFWERELAELSGDFAGAEKALKDQHDFAKDSSLERRDYATVAFATVELYSEIGRDADAAAVAADFLSKEDAWAADRGPAHAVLAADPVPVFLAAQLRAKTIDRKAFEAARGAWVAKWKARVAPRYLHRVWTYGYAAIATTKELADEALAARADLDALTPPPSPLFEEEIAMGRAYELAGDHESARPHLERAVHGLWTLHTVIDETQAEELYAESLETADPARACAEYEVVLERWGSAKASVTGARAAARFAALKCKPPAK